jgi:hypothetical protein
VPEGSPVDQVPSENDQVSPDKRPEVGEQDGTGRQLSRGERQALATIGGTVGLLSGVAQFLGSYFQSGLKLLAASVTVVVCGLALTFVAMRGWRAGKRKVALSINIIVLVVLVLLFLGVLGGAVGRSIGILARPSPITSLSPTIIPSSTTVPSATSTPGKFSYVISASPAGPNTVRVVTTASGQPVPGLTYWFILQVNYGTGYVEYYPRRKMTGESESFEVTIPAGADTRYVRSGQIYGLNNTQNSQAEDKLEQQGATGVNDYFTKELGQPVSGAVKLPY